MGAYLVDHLVEESPAFLQLQDQTQIVGLGSDNQTWVELRMSELVEVVGVHAVFVVAWTGQEVSWLVLLPLVPLGQKEPSQKEVQQPAPSQGLLGP